MIAMSDEPGIFEVPKGDLPEHYAAIGRLVTAFSDIEKALNDVIRSVIGQHAGAGLGDELSRALTGEMRAGDLIAHLRRILDARDRDAMIAGNDLPPKPDAMNAVFKEIRELKNVRDQVAHHRFFVRQRAMIFTNVDTVRSSPAAQFNPYAIEELNEMAEYAGRLVKRLYLLRPALFLISAAADMTRDPALLEIPSRLRSADRSRKAGRERQRQPRSSLA